jgi:hypothetical protein
LSASPHFPDTKFVPTIGAAQLVHVPLLMGALHPKVNWPMGQMMQDLLMHVPLFPGVLAVPDELPPR